MKKETSEILEDTPADDSAPSKLYAGYVGLDVHKDSIAVAIAYAGREDPESWGAIPNTRKAIAKLVDRLYLEKKTFLLCYEAGPCGYTLYKNLTAMGMDCQVVAPPRNEKIKTDRRDALRLARLLRAGELVEVWVPDQEQEAVRDLCRCRADFKAQQQKLRQQLNAFVLRHGHHWPTKQKRWTQKHLDWLESLDFPYDYQAEVRDEYIAAVRLSSSRMTDLDQKLNQALQNWSWAPLANSLMALRGFDQLSAVTLLSETGRRQSVHVPQSIDGVLGIGALRLQFRGAPPHRRCHAGREPSCPAGLGRIRLVLSFPGPSDCLHEPKGGRRFRLCPSYRLESAETVMWAVSKIDRGRQETRRWFAWRLRAS